MDTDIRRPYVATIITLSGLSPSNFAAAPLPGDERIVCVMIESHLGAGRQDLKEGCKLTYGQSITDACISWEDSLGVLAGLAESVKQRRVARGSGN